MVEKIVNGIKFIVNHVSSRFDGKFVNDFYWNTFRLIIENEEGKTLARELDNYTMEKQTELTEEQFIFLIRSVKDCYYVNSSIYPTFADYCDDCGYEITDEELKKEFEINVTYGDKLQTIVTKNWIDDMEIYFQLLD